jgi:uncharacterized protein YbjT (DUF2867 family)
MKIAITTPSGHVGSAVADHLLDFGDEIQVRLLARRPQNLERFVQRGAELAIGSQDDKEFLVSTTRDVDALFWVTPPGYGSDDLRTFQIRMGQAAAHAIRTNRIPRVVNLSSIGAQLGSKVGPINGLHDVETLLNEATDQITHLRPGFFFENVLMQKESISKWGKISFPCSGACSYPMIATRDIGKYAAERLADTDWAGLFFRELHGPEDMSFERMAAILTNALERKIVFVQCSPHEAREAYHETGMSEDVAHLMLEMFHAIDTGRLQPLQPRTPQTTTQTTLFEFAHEVLMPLIAQPVSV